MIAMRRKAQQDAAAFSPEDKEEALYWAKEVLRQVSYAQGGIAEACVHWTGEERIDAAGRVHDMNQRDPVTVLTIVRRDEVA